VTDAVYPDRTALLADCLPIVDKEVHALVDEGAAYIQLDFGFAAYVNDTQLDAMRQQGLDPEQELAGDIAAENSIYDTLPRDRVTLGIHICRGNRTAWGGGVGSYEWLSERLFRDLHVDRFVLEYDSDRAGGFEPLRHVPEGKVVALGLVTTKSPQLESQETLLRRIDEAARYCPIERLALCPQCGFQSSALRDGAFMTMDDERRKLELIVDTARKVWG
jgi:5-methyltetrahydropteroyltriglutamate--homocysteine methyltransferase